VRGRSLPPREVRPSDAASPAATLATVRTFLLALLVGGALGTLADLLLSKHWEDEWQFVPLVLLALGALVPGVYALTRARAVLRALRLLMGLFIASGFVGMYLHYSAKTEFALERHPDFAGLALFREAIKGSSPPILGPGAMIVLGLIGLAWTWRHPLLEVKTGAPGHSTGAE